MKTGLLVNVTFTNILLTLFVIFTALRPFFFFETSKAVFYLEVIVFLWILPQYYSLVFQGFHPSFIILGLCIGYLGLIFSRLALKTSFKEAISFCFCTKLFTAHYWGPLKFFPQQFFVASYEELFWRGALQTFLGNNYIAIIIVAILFTIRHLEILYGDLWRLLDFFLFSLLLGISYFLTRSIAFVVVVHAIRNLGVLYYHKTYISETGIN